MTFRLKELIFVGNSLYPAEIVGFPAENWVEVKWLESAGVNWECIHPLSSIKPMQGRRTRTKTKKYTQEDETSVESGGNKRAARSTRNNAAAKRYQPKKIAVKKPPPKRNKNATSENGSAEYPKKRRMVARITTGIVNTMSSFGQSVARMPHDESSSSSDEEILERARRQRVQRTLSNHDDRKPAAKPTVRLDFSLSGDSSGSDDNDEALTASAESEESSSDDSTSSDDDFDSSDDYADFKRIRSVAKDRKPVTKRRNKPYATNRRGKEGSNESASGQDTSPKPPKRVQVKQEEEEVFRLIRDTFKINDHVWVRDGKKNEPHPAVVTKVLDDDFLEIQWADCRVKKKVPKYIASLMFDLTTSDANNEGRPRRSTRARHQPKRHDAASLFNKESRTAAKRGKESKERMTKTKKLRSKNSKTKNVARRPKSKKVVADDSSDTVTHTEPAVEHYADTNIGDPVLLRDSSDSDSDPGLSVSSVATFEYTAPRVDPKFRSLHNITNLHDFICVEHWTHKEGPQNDNVVMKTIVEGKNEDKSDEEHQMDFSLEEVTRGGAGKLQVATAQYSPSSADYPRLSLECEPFVFDKLRGTSGGEPLASAEIQARTVSLDGPPDSNRQSNETANFDDLPDILLPFDSEAAVNEDRLTADTQELSQAFAALRDCDFEYE